MRACEVHGSLILTPKDVYPPTINVPEGYSIIAFRIPVEEDAWLTKYGAVEMGLPLADSPRLILHPKTVQVQLTVQVPWGRREGELVVLEDGAQLPVLSRRVLS